MYAYKRVHTHVSTHISYYYILDDSTRDSILPLARRIVSVAPIQRMHTFTSVNPPDDKTPTPLAHSLSRPLSPSLSLSPTIPDRILSCVVVVVNGNVFGKTVVFCFVGNHGRQARSRKGVQRTESDYRRAQSERQLGHIGSETSWKLTTR